MPDRRATGSTRLLQSAYQRLSRCSDLVAAADCLKSIGQAIGMPHPAVIDDYSLNRLLTIDDGRALSSVLGWDADIVEQWLRQELHLVSPIAAACRMSTSPCPPEAASWR